MTEQIVLAGALDPLVALDLRVRLTAATQVLRPRVLVDLGAVERVHPAAIAALISGARHAAGRGGELRVVPPRCGRARAELDLAGWFPVGSAAAPAV